MKNKIKLLMQSVFQICGSFEVWPHGTCEDVKCNLDATFFYGDGEVVCFCESDFFKL